VKFSAARAGHLLARWFRIVGRFAPLVLILAVLATGVAGYYTVSRIGINTSTTDMLSPDLPFRRHDAAISRAFPQLSDTLIVVVDGDTADLAADAAAALAEAMAARPQVFRSVFYPEGDPFFRRNGLMYLDLVELQALSDRLAEAQPLLSALNEDPSLRGLVGVLNQALGDDDGDGGTARAAVAPVLDKMAAAVDSLAEARAGQARAWIGVASPNVRPNQACTAGWKPTADTLRSDCFRDTVPRRGGDAADIRISPARCPRRASAHAPQGHRASAAAPGIGRAALK